MIAVEVDRNEGRRQDLHLGLAEGRFALPETADVAKQLPDVAKLLLSMRS
jgi:hypothetical protein